MRIEDLSTAQRQFAQRHEAEVVLDADHGAVFLYHTDRGATYRWLVDRAGRTLETIRFSDRPTPAGLT